MIHYTLITNAQHEEKVLSFLLSLGLYETTQNLYLQLHFIIKSANGQNDYCLCYNDESHKMFKEELWELGECLEMEEFLDAIKKSLPKDPTITIFKPFKLEDYFPITAAPSHGKTFIVKDSFKPELLQSDPIETPDWVLDAQHFAKHWDSAIIPEKHYTKFEIQHYNPMRQITLENLESILPEEVVVVFQDKRDPVSEKRKLFLLSTYIPREVTQFEGYGFMSTSNPLSETRIFRSDSKIKSIEFALKAGHEIYVCEEITRIQFSNSKPKSLEDFIKEKQERMATTDRVEAYVISLIEQHSEYLRSELGLTQYPKEIYSETTQKFIKEKLK